MFNLLHLQCPLQDVYEEEGLRTNQLRFQIKPFNAKWFTKVNKTPTHMTGDIIEQDVIV